MPAQHPTWPSSIGRAARSPLSRRAFFSATGLAALGAGLVACGGGGNAGSAGPSSASGGASSAAAGAYGAITVQLSWIKNIEFAGEYFADSKGYYTAAGFKSVNLKTGPVDSADALVAAGTVDVGLSAPDATAKYIVNQGADLKIIGSIYQKNPFCILSLKEGKPISTVADLAGKTIGIQAGTNQSIFDGFLKANKVDPSTFKTTVVQYDPKVLEEKKVDGFMAYLTNEPFLVAGDGFTPVTLSFADNGLPLTAEVFTVSSDTLSSKRDMLKAFLTAEIKGWSDVIADPQAGAELAVNTYGKGLGLKLDEQLKEIKAQNELIVTDDTKKNGIFTLTQDFQTKICAAIGDVGVSITPADLFDMSLLTEIYQANPDLIKA